MGFSDDKFADQWHLNASTRGGLDLNVMSVWADYTGKGVTVGVIDTKIESTHIDLNENWTMPFGLTSYGFSHSDVVATTLGPNDDHGTAVAGIIAAAANGTGSVGVAHQASITSMPALSMSSDAVTQALRAGAEVDVVNNSWGFSLGYANSTNPAFWTKFNAAIDHGLLHGRDGLGSIYVNSSGNSRADGRDTADQQFSAHTGTIVVAAADINGNITSYSTGGSAVFVTAFGGDRLAGIATSDVSGTEGYGASDQITNFTGTSAAAPMVSGIVALMLEANPDLGWRDVQDILAASARQLEPAVENAGGNWNGGGLHFSNDSGFGLVDALAAVRMAEAHAILDLGPKTNANLVTATDFELEILTGAPSQAQIDFVVDQAIDVEAIVLNLRLGTADWSDLEIILTSPNGTKSVLLAPSFGTAGQGPDGSWPLGSNAFRGEDGQGAWSVSITSKSGKSLGIMATATLEVEGALASSDDKLVFTDAFAAVAGPEPVILVDEAGRDAIDASAVTGAVIVDLKPGAGSIIAGKGVQIDAGTIIEMAVTGDGNDKIIGNDVDNRLAGGRGDDQLFGQGGNDIFIDMDGNDGYIGGAGLDTLIFDFAFAELDHVGFDTIGNTAWVLSDGDTDIFTGIETLVFADRSFIAGSQAGLEAQLAQAWASHTATAGWMMAA